MISVISQTYLFSDTPIQLLSFFFLLVVIYGIAGSRALLRLNVLFLPIVLIAIVLLSLLNINLMEINNLLPAFQTKVSQYAVGVKNSILRLLDLK